MALNYIAPRKSQKTSSPRPHHNNQVSPYNYLPAINFPSGCGGAVRVLYGSKLVR